MTTHCSQRVKRMMAKAFCHSRCHGLRHIHTAEDDGKHRYAYSHAGKDAVHKILIKHERGIQRESRESQGGDTEHPYKPRTGFWSEHNKQNQRNHGYGQRANRQIEYPWCRLLRCRCTTVCRLGIPRLLGWLLPGGIHLLHHELPVQFTEEDHGFHVQAWGRLALRNKLYDRSRLGSRHDLHLVGCASVTRDEGCSLGDIISHIQPK